jgi:hypothetical protein
MYYGATVPGPPVAQVVSCRPTFHIGPVGSSTRPHGIYGESSCAGTCVCPSTRVLLSHNHSFSDPCS